MEFTEEVVEELTPMLWSIARLYTEDLTLMKDLVQEGWIGVRIACNQYNSNKGASLKTYAYSRARKKMQKYVQYRKDLVHIPLAHDVKCCAIEYYPIKDDRQSEAGKYTECIEEVQKLPKELRAIVVMRFWDGESVQTIANHYGRSRQYVVNRIKKALNILRESL